METHSEEEETSVGEAEEGRIDRILEEQSLGRIVEEGRR